MGKRYLGVLVVVCMILLGMPAFATGTGESAGGSAKPERLSFAGGPSGGAYYPISLACAKVFMDAIPGLQVDVAASAGSVENPLLVGTGEHDFGITTTDTAFEAFNGVTRFAGKKLGDLRIMFSGLSGGRIHIVAGKDITSIEQLRGKHIAMGPEGGATPVAGMLILEAYGIRPDEVTLSYVSYSEGMTMLMDGQVAASFAAGASPLPAVQEVAARQTFEYNLLSLDPKIGAKITAKNPVFGVGVLPAGTYGRQKNDVLVLQTGNIMLTNANVPEKVIYELTKSIFKNLEVLYAAHPSAKVLKLETAASSMVIPYHPGAERFYREQGVWPKK